MQRYFIYFLHSFIVTVYLVSSSRTAVYHQLWRFQPSWQKKPSVYFWPCLDTRCLDSFDVERTYPYLTFLQSHSFHFNVRKSIHQKLPCTSEVFLMGPSSTKETFKVKLNQWNTLLYNYMFMYIHIYVCIYQDPAR